ncbi:L-seryl-tRNA(Sec) selenium transferase [Bacillus pinisoli]|uniref:L-seryl-tRNA(Sec) selenium transferase n=1 Tax=Bacillus pinisoli TaxID=2901866 RepID=UPI001FF45D41
MKEYLRFIPPVHELQKHEQFTLILEKTELQQEKLTQLLQEEIHLLRQNLLNGNWIEKNATKESLISYLFDQLTKAGEKYSQYFLRKVINATGTILHTNLGRARLSEPAIQHVMDIAKYYSNLEYRIEEGERGSRHDIIEGLIRSVTGAEAAMVVNNNAAAVYLILRALAKDKEVIVSRGQLVEIGGSFRISSIMEESGANLVEVGTTNKTHLYDYEDAITEQTKMIMKVHTSNFKTIGFTKSVTTDELLDLTRKHEEIIFYEDLGSGVLYDFRQHGIGDEPVVSEVLKQGADLVSFSGDKLLGGPQAGIIAGKKVLIDKLKKHQLARVLRVDKLTFAALEATLLAYLKGTEKMMEIPVIRDMLIKPEEILQKAEQFKSILLNSSKYQLTIEQDVSQVGGGTMPDVELSTYVVTLTHPIKNAELLSKELRLNDPSIVTRVRNNQVIFDFRTIQSSEIDDIIKRLHQMG